MILQTPTPNLKKSIQFYSSLGFEMINTEGRHYARENGAIVEINPDRFARAGIKLYQENWADTVNKLRDWTDVIKNEQGYLLSDPSNVWIYLIEGQPEIDIADLTSTPSKLGAFAGMSLESVDADRSVKIWTSLGFQHDSGAIEQGWVSHKHRSGMVVSIMKPNACPHLFFNPSFTYFNAGKNPDIIKEIRSAGVEITEEITHFNDQGIVDNVILRDPGGFGFFVFND